MRRIAQRLGLVVALSAALFAVVPAAAPARAQGQDAASEDASPADSRATAFRAVEGPQTEHVPGGALMIGAYAVVWVLLLLFVVRLGLLQSRTAREIDRLRDRLGEAGEAPPPE